MVQNVG
jgi:hypothetical protein